MRVSVIIPTFNRADMIGRTIDSVIRQSYDDIEIIVVDDGSTDDTAEVIDAISRRSPKQILYYKKENGGCASARNKGVVIASGELITFLDSDDLWEPNAVETMVSALVECKADFVYSPAIERFENGREVVNHPVAAGRPGVLAEEHFKSSNVRNGASLFRREVFAEVGMLDESLHHNEDSDFLQRAAIHCKAAYSPAPTVIIPRHAGQKSRNRVAIYKALLKSTRKILAENPQFAESLGDAAAERLIELQVNLAEALVAAGKFGEARAAARDAKSHVSLPLRLSLYGNTRAPLRIRQLYRKFKERLLR
ncbi:MAG: glycosyltransferase family A protein [Candidatus Latescibacterota bacterium]